MRKIAVLFLCLFIAGCSSSKKDVFLGETHLPVQTSETFQNQTVDDILKIYGEPLTVRTEEPNMLWTYYQNGCTRFIYFNQKKLVSYAETRGQNCQESLEQQEKIQ